MGMFADIGDIVNAGRNYEELKKAKELAFIVLKKYEDEAVRELAHEVLRICKINKDRSSGLKKYCRSVGWKGKSTGESE